MYGIINQAIYDLVTDTFGEEALTVIKEKASLSDIDSFDTLSDYPDEITYKLVTVASEVSGLSAAEVLFAFGKYWIPFTDKKGYGLVMKLFGTNIEKFLSNLNALHNKMGKVMKGMQPPRFRYKKLDEGSFELHYSSKREGLIEIVHGMLFGLSEKFEQEIKVDIKQIENSNDAVFTVHII